jgi:hypothetical protein
VVPLGNEKSNFLIKLAIVILISSSAKFFPIQPLWPKLKAKKISFNFSASGPNQRSGLKDSGSSTFLSLRWIPAALLPITV